MKTPLIILAILFFPFTISYSQTIDISQKIRDMNKLTPMRIDEATTFVAATYIGKTIQYNFVVKDEYISLIDKNEYKKSTLRNLANSETNAAFLYFINEGIYMNHAIYDEKRNLKFIIKISPNDLKTVYKINK